MNQVATTYVNFLIFLVELWRRYITLPLPATLTLLSSNSEANENITPGAGVPFMGQKRTYFVMWFTYTAR